METPPAISVRDTTVNRADEPPRADEAIMYSPSSHPKQAEVHDFLEEPRY